MDEFIDYSFDRENFDYFYSVSPAEILLNYVDEMLEDSTLDSEIPMDGIAFEHWCARQLETQGWIVAVSKASGDQGTDVVAERDGKKVAIQCKRYTNPIGNKAVQEAFTGAQNVDAGESCVVGTGGFTASAKQIAAKTGVKLLDAANIKSFSEVFGFKAIAVEEDAEHLSVEDVDDEIIQLCFDRQGGGCIGTLLRSLVSTSGAEKYGLSSKVGNALLVNLEENTGHGTVAIERSALGTLLVLAAHAFKSQVALTDTNLHAMSEVIYYDTQALGVHHGENVFIEDIIKTDVLQEAYSFLFATAESLGPLYKEFLDEKLAEVLFSSSDEI